MRGIKRGRKGFGAWRRITFVGRTENKTVQMNVHARCGIANPDLMEFPLMNVVHRFSDIPPVSGTIRATSVGYD